MKQHFNNIKNSIFVLFAVIASFCVSSCTGGDGGGACTKCIDNKPAPTTFSNTLNAINHTITLDQGMTMINNFGLVRESMVSDRYIGGNTLPVYETFNLEAIDALICQPNAVGFRIYMGMDGQNQVRFVLVGVDGDGKDIIQRKTENPGIMADAASGHSVLVYEAGQRWP